MNLMAHSQSPPTEACVWMTAGLLSYKLCDRQFDCDHCPLDAALRGGCVTSSPGGPVKRQSASHAELFPVDRQYSLGHTWLAPSREGELRLRFGLDRFAASLISCPHRLRWRTSSRVLDRQATVCELELDEGILRLGTPIAARLVRRNRQLRENPGVLVTAPYDLGWIVELEPVEKNSLDDLISAQSASEEARLDLQCLRRRVAHHLLSEIGSDDWILANGAGSLADLRLLLGASAYMHLVCELVH